MTSNKAKTYIPDTNIAIDDTYFLQDFLRDKENKVVLPDVVMSEINGLKTHPEIGYEARAFTDYIFTLLNSTTNITKGIPVPISLDGKILGGKLFFTNDYKTDEGKDLLDYTTDIGFNDLQIIRAAAVHKEKNPRENVVLVSNDKNVINVAKLNGIKAEYMRKDSADPSKLNKGYHLFRPSQGFLNDLLMFGDKPIPIASLDQKWAEDLIANQYVVFVNDETHKAIEESYKYATKGVVKKAFSIEPKFIKRYDIHQNALVSTKYKNTPICGFNPRNIEQLLLIDQLLDNDIHIKVTRAEAGTGKSFLELLVALHKTMQRREKGNKDDAKVYVVRRAIFMEEYGFLPGDIVDKNIPTYEGVAENYRQIMKSAGGAAKAYAPLLSDALKEDNGLIELLPFGTIRGVTIGPNCIVIGEEWQNTEIKFSKIMMDRNSNGEVYLNGDTEQKDNPHTSLERNGLTYMAKKIQEISQNARATGDPMDLYDASIAGVMTLQHPERGIISLWSNRNLHSRSGR
jgi:PhoH-like ATPase